MNKAAGEVMNTEEEDSPLLETSPRQKVKSYSRGARKQKHNAMVNRSAQVATASQKGNSRQNMFDSVGYQ